VGYSERGGVMVEPYLSDQWFVSMKSLAEPALNAVVSGKIQFHPERWIKVYENWMNNIRDWCISRQLWWGHQIPVWYNKSTGEQYCEMEAPKDTGNWEQDPDVLDTWFSSWLWPFSTMGWPEKTADLDKFFPTDLLSTAPDIIFFWVARMIMASIEFTDRIPFKDVYFHNIIRDEKGRKMSKSLGNSPDVFDVIDKYGTDALRFTLVYLSPQGVDVWFSEDKCEIGRNFANKIWNASRFLMMKKEQIEKEPGKSNQTEYKQDLFDKWIDSRLNTTIELYINALYEYKINEASKALHEFIWGDFCDWYIELIKIKTADNPEEASGLINKAFNVFDKTLRLLHPVMPFITEELWGSISDRKSNESISISEFPVLDKSVINASIENEMKEMQEIVTAIRNLRAEISLSPAKKCNVLLKCEDEESMKTLDDISSYIKYLGKVEVLDVLAKNEFDKLQKFKSITAVVNEVQVYLKIEGLIDVEQEKKKLEKEIKRTEDFLASIDKKLNNENFINKASEDVIENERKKREETLSKLEKLKEHFQTITE
jgi:valyl-tRNA synthetase